MKLTEQLELLNKLEEDHKPLWGKMTPQHMVEHLYKTFQTSINEISLEIYTEERKITVLKKLFLRGRPLPKEFMNLAIGPDLLPLEFESLESAIDELTDIINRCEIFFKSNPEIKTIHPVFGYLTKEEWDIFHEKHFRHHLSQFGLID